MDYADNSRFSRPQDDGVRQRRDRRYALHLPGQTSLTEEAPMLSFIELGVIKEVANRAANNAFNHAPPAELLRSEIAQLEARYDSGATLKPGARNRASNNTKI